MKITKITTYRLPPRWMFLKIETDEGVKHMHVHKHEMARRNCEVHHN